MGAAMLRSATALSRVASPIQQADAAGGLGLLDGAIVSAFCLPQPLPPGEEPLWDGLRALPLGRLRLQLVAAAPATRWVLLPPRGAAPLLHQAVIARGFTVELTEVAEAEFETPSLKIRDSRQGFIAMKLISQPFTSRAS